MISAMAWIFGLGAAAVAFPLLFHLIRRTPRGQTEFSSLMFLKPSPPSLTRRSRLDNLLLLLLRALAICLLAAAFMRPFFRGNSELAEFDVDHRRVAILMDVSASMRRGDLWQQARATASQVLDELEPKDEVALLAFDQSARNVIGFPTQAVGDPPESNATTVAAVRDALEDLEPGWLYSDLGGSLVSVANELDSWNDQTRNDRTGRRPKLQLIVISDMQASADTTALQTYQWPQRVKVDLRSVALPQPDNATVEVLPPSTEETPPQLRVRVSNGDDVSSHAFEVRWSSIGAPDPNRESTGDNPSQRDGQPSLSFVVPAGNRRVLRVPLAETLGAEQFVLSGDSESYDNTFFVAPPRQRRLALRYLGTDDGDDPQSLYFYLQRAFTDTATRVLDVQQIAPRRLESEDWAWPNGPPDQRPGVPGLTVVAQPMDADQVAAIQELVGSGAWVLAVLSSTEVTQSLVELTGARPRESNSQSRADYRILGEIDYQDPVFQPFTNPAFSDFTGIKFWRYQEVELESDCEVLARFDNRDPAVWVRRDPSGGRVITLAAGWRPSDSQFALSPKFVALLVNLLEQGSDLPQLDTTLTVNQSIVFPPAEQGRVIIKPNGVEETVEPGQTRFRETFQPGIYRLQSGTMEDDDAVANRGEAGSEEERFAVNLDRRESDSAILSVEQLERLGVEVGTHRTAAAELEQLRELRDREIEGRQRLWKWLIVLAIGVLVVESLLAGRKASPMVPG